MLFRQLFDRESSTYTYLIADEATGKAALIDPVREQFERDAALVRELGLDLLYSLDTHVHADHVTAAARLRADCGARTVAGNAGAECADVHVSAGDILLLGNLEIRVLSTPGHTDDSVSYSVGDRVFTGDALLVRGCGRTDFQNGDAGELYDSITKVLFELPPDTLVYPGHDYRGHSVSTIAEERAHNPRVAGKTRGEFIDLMSNLALGMPKKIMEAVPANRQCGRAEATAS